MTRFRRHLAKVPFFLAIALPGLMAALYFVSRSHAVHEVEVTGDTVCIETQVGAGSVIDACPDGKALAGE